MKILKTFTTNYKKVGKHRKKCRLCNLLIQDGEQVRMVQVKTEKYYPVKGLMWFTKWQFSHEACALHHEAAYN